MTRTRPMLPLFAAVAIVIVSGCSTPMDSGDEDGAPIDSSCSPSAPPSELSLDPFYEKYCDIEGIPIVASGEVPDAALATTATIVAQMIEPLSNSEVAGLRAIRLRVGVIGAEQVTTDMPEYSDLDTAFPGVDWDGSSRGLGATRERPLTSSGEENLLCYPGDGYAGESILVHEFGHTIKQFARPAADPGFESRVARAYDDAMRAGLWTDTYASTDPEEYWAEGVQSYFDLNLSADSPDGVHNYVDTRLELAEYDPALFGLVDEVFDGVTVDPPCS